MADSLILDCLRLSTPVRRHYAGADPDGGRILRIRVDPNGRQALGEADLPAGAAADSHLLAHVPVRQRDRCYEVAVRQTYEAREVGRLTRCLAPGALIWIPELRR